VNAVFVVVADLVSHQPAKMLLIQHVELLSKGKGFKGSVGSTAKEDPDGGEE